MKRSNLSVILIVVIIGVAAYNFFEPMGAFTGSVVWLILVCLVAFYEYKDYCRFKKQETKEVKNKEDV